MVTYDEGLFRTINSGPESWSPFMVWLSTAFDQKPVLYTFIALVLGMIAWPKTRRAAIESLIAFPLANSLTDQFKHFLPEPRPFQVISETILRVGWSDSMGTASAHAANMAAVAFVMFYRHRWKASIWVFLAFGVGYSRAFTGAHFPHQVLLGWLCGSLVAYLVVSISNLISDRYGRGKSSGEPSLITESG